MEILKNITPTARKEHICDFCGGVIAIGEKYDRQTNVFDGRVYDWICHCKCSEIAQKLNMYDGCDDDGLDSSSFDALLTQYVYDNHYDKEIDDIAKDWKLSPPELVKKILEELAD